MEPEVLFISPHAEDAAILSRMLSLASMQLDHAEDLQQARSKLEQEKYPVVLTAAELSDGSWEDVLRLSRQLGPSAEVIVTHPFADPIFWAEALNSGAYDLLAQPFEAPEVLSHPIQCLCASAVSPRARNVPPNRFRFRGSYDWLRLLY